MSDQYESKIPFPFTVAPNQIWEIGLSGNEIAILLRILYRAGLRGQCFESRTSIAEACSMTERTVSTCFMELERLNIVHIIRRKVEKKTNLITVNSPDVWISKRKNFPQEGFCSEMVSPQKGNDFPSRREIVSHRTRSPELNSIEQDSFLNIAIDSVVASQVIEPEVLDDRMVKERANKKEAQTTALVTLEATTSKASSSPTMSAWQAYLEAFETKYRVEPQRNARVMGQLKKFVEFVGMLDAPDILRFYLTCNDQWYVKNMHSVGIALSQAEKLAAGFRGARVFTAKEAQQIDSMQTSQNYVNDYIRTREAHENAQNRDD